MNMVLRTRTMTLLTLGGIAVMACAFSARVAATAPATAALRYQELAKGEGKEVVEKLCGTTCHTVERFVDERRSKSQWADTIEQMKGAGARASDADFKTTLSYLVARCGIQVKINTATAKVIDDALDLEPGQADAIVKYREAHGPFADWKAFLAVPGLDAKKLEEQKANVVF